MGNKEEAKTVTAGGLQNFQRNTSKYWVKKEDIMRVKTIVTENLPINIFTSDSSRFLQEPTDSAFISSVYYDNPNTMELYEGRLRKSQGAIAVRFRKYEHGEEIFVERKTHHESWITGSSSIKERFDLDPSDVYNFVRGTYKSDDFTKRLETQGKSEKAIKEAVKLFEEIQQAIILRHLVPCVTTACDRTAFQIPGDAKVRISLDIDLHMIKESLKLKNDGKWCKDQFQISEEDIHNFPYAILEVKLQTHEGYFSLFNFLSFLNIFSASFSFSSSQIIILLSSSYLLAVVERCHGFSPFLVQSQFSIFFFSFFFDCFCIFMLPVW